MRLPSLVLAGLLLTLAAGPRIEAGRGAQPLGPAPLAFVGGTIITATGAPPVADGVVVVEAGRITAVGPRADVRIPANAQRIDTTGRYLTPGLIDTNVHLVLMITPEFYVKYEGRFADIAVQAAQVALKYGVTTVADSWGPLADVLAARDRIDRGEVPGSRVLVAGNIVGLGGPFSPYFLNGAGLRNGDWVHPMIRRRINAQWEVNVGPRLLALTPAEVAAEMRAYLARGVDFVKVGVSAHGIGPVEPMLFTVEALKAMRDEVVRAGRPFQTHTFTIESLRVAVELGGVDLLQHPDVMNLLPPSDPAGPRMLPDALLRQMVEKRIYAGMIPPSRANERILREWRASDHPRHYDLNELMLGRQLGSSPAMFDQRVANAQKMIRAGVPFTLATDMGPEAEELGPVVWGRMGRRHFEVLESLQDLGADPMDIIVGATRRGAEAYRLGDRLGTLEPGKIADLLVLDADPLESLGHFRRIRTVVKDGRIVDRAALPTLKVLTFDPEAPWPF